MFFGRDDGWIFFIGFVIKDSLAGNICLAESDDDDMDMGFAPCLALPAKCPVSEANVPCLGETTRSKERRPVLPG